MVWPRPPQQFWLQHEGICMLATHPVHASIANLSGSALLSAAVSRRRLCLPFQAAIGHLNVNSFSHTPPCMLFGLAANDLCVCFGLCHCCSSPAPPSPFSPTASYPTIFCVTSPTTHEHHGPPARGDQEGGGGTGEAGAGPLARDARCTILRAAWMWVGGGALCVWWWYCCGQMGCGLNVITGCMHGAAGV